MQRHISIQMMGEFVISVDGQEISSLVSRSRKGVALIEYLILNKGKQVPKRRLINILWSGYMHTNPESSLKTLVSRTRKMLGEIDEDLAACIASERGSYRWESLDTVRIDMLEIMEIFERLARETERSKSVYYYDRLISLYKGDLFLTGDIEGGEGYEVALHNEYLNAIYDYIEILMEEGEYDRIISVCRKALRIDEFDERLHMEMMQAQVASGRVDDAMEQYHRMADMNEQYLDVAPSEEMQAFYEKIIRSGNSMKYNVESVKKELRTDTSIRGAYQCDYPEFRRIFNLINPTLERLGCSIFLGLVMLREPEGQVQWEPKGQGQKQQPGMQKLMDSLLEVICLNLRRGDVVTQYSQTIAAVMLPTVNYTTGNMVMERIRQMFFEKNPEANVPFHYRLIELGNANRNF